MSLAGRNSVCPFRGRLEAFQDAEISLTERRQIEAHLSECAACRQRLQELQGLTRVLQAYSTPPDGWSGDAEFWRNVAPRLLPRALPAEPVRAMQPPSFLAPLSVVVSSLALRGLAASVLVVYALYQWRLLPGSWSVALGSTARIALGPEIWRAGQGLYNLAASTPYWTASVTLWVMAFEAVVAALLLILSGLHIGWLLRWLRSGPGLQNEIRTE